MKTLPTLHTARCYSLVMTLAALALMALSPAILAQPRLPGQFEVGASGAATYTIPIEVPPGTGGVEPALALHYSSQSGDGIVGLGWSLGGLPEISRCAQTVAQDGVKGSINNNADDRFCLNGDRLVAISGTYGANNTEYRTELESFAKIISYGSEGTGPEWFKVWTKTGQVMEFGHTEDSQVFHDSTVRQWHVNRIADTTSNYLTVSYEDEDNGYVYPTEIHYTGNTAESLSPYNKVTFVYDTDRPDQVPQYTAGALTLIEVLLTNIKTWEGENLVSDYVISYVDDANSVRTSKVESVKRCGSDSSCLPETTFTWPDYNDAIGFTTDTSWTGGSGVKPEGSIGDFNGDGLPDFMRHITPVANPDHADVYFWMSDGPGDWTSEIMEAGFEDWPPWEIYGFDFNGQTLTGLLLDMNADSYSDIIVNQTAVYVFPSLPDIPYGPLRLSANINDQNGELPISYAYGDATHPQPIGDLNGDGQDDLLLLQASPSAALTYLSDGDGSFTAGPSISGLYNDSFVVPGDFNGDGCMDLLSQLATDKIFFSCDVPTPSVDIEEWAESGYKLVAGDYNGDGNTDVLLVHQYNESELWLSSGVELVGPLYLGVTDWFSFQINAGDFNGDSRADLAIISGSSGIYPHEILLSTGIDFISSSGISNATGVTTARVHDFNGDGVTDIWINKGTTTNTNTLHTTNHNPMLITAIADGLGQTTNIVYDRLNSGTDTYTKGTGASYPIMDMIGSQYVVSEALLPNGIGSGQVTYEHTYEGARLDHAGRGFLGFENHTVTEDRSIVEEENIITRTTYRQDYPFIGLVEEQTITHDSVVLSKTTNTYAATTLSGGTGGARRFVKLTETVVETRDPDDTALPTYTTSYNSYDDYGNALTIVVSGSGGDTKTTENTYGNDTTNWFLGRLETASTDYELGEDDPITRIAGFEYFSTTGLLKKEIIEPGNTDTGLILTTEYTRDPFGNITVTELSGIDIDTQTTETEYDNKGRFVVETTNAEGHVDEFEYEPKFGQLTEHIDPNGLVTTFLYDAHGRQTRITDDDGRYRQTAYSYCSGVNGGSATCPSYGAMQVETTPWRSGGSVQSGAKSRVFVDKLGRTLAQDAEGLGAAWSRVETQFDAIGRMYRTSQPYFLSGGTAKWTTFDEYDPLGRVTRTLYPDSSETNTSYTALETTVTDDLDQTTVTTLNAQGRIASVSRHWDEEDEDVTTTYLYNATGDLIEIKDPANNTITHTVDTRGRIIESEDPSLGTWTYAYTVLDQLKLQTDAMAQETAVEYDMLGRVTEVDVDEGAFVSSFTWDTATYGIGKLKEMATNAGDKRTHTYDSDSRPASTTLRIDSTDYTYSYAYDADNLLYTVQYPSGFTSRYEYTSNQKVLQTLKSHSNNGALWTANTRNAAGQYTQATIGASAYQINRSFDANTGRITGTTAGASNGIANFSYGWDTLGNLTSRSDTNMSVTETFTYDSLNRLTEAAISGVVSKLVEYDAVGNIIKKTKLGSSGGGGSFNTYNYPSAEEPMPYAVTDISGILNGDDDPEFTYDDNGNLTEGAGREVTWNAFNKVAELTGNSTTLTYTYDAGQQRISQDDGSNLIHYLNDPIMGIATEYHSDDGGIWYDYLFVEGQRVGLRRKVVSEQNPTWQVYVHDHLGSIAVVTNGSGTVLERLAFDAWGKRRNTDGTDASSPLTFPTSRGFTDHEHLMEVGLINMNARIYDPELGRFMSADPIIPQLFDTQGINRYSYVLNNPVRYTDPHGLESVDINGNHNFYPTTYLSGYFRWMSIYDSHIYGSGYVTPSVPRITHKPGLAGPLDNFHGSPWMWDVTAKAAKVEGSFDSLEHDLGGDKFSQLIDSGYAQEGAVQGTRSTFGVAATAAAAVPGSTLTAAESQEALGVAWWALNVINPKSIADNYEYAGLVYQDASGNFIATEAIRGAAPCTPTGCGSNPWAALSLVPCGRSCVVLDYHTHGPAYPGITNEYFSGQIPGPAGDHSGINRDGRNPANPAYLGGVLGTPGGESYFYPAGALCDTCYSPALMRSTQIHLQSIAR